MEPLTLADLKAHLRIDHDHEDQLIEGVISTARRIAEEFSGRAFIQRTMRYEACGFPTETGARSDHIKLALPPLVSITSFEYLDESAGTFATWASTNYIVDTTAEPGRVYRAYEVSWPTIRQQHNAVKITYVTGNATGSSDVPEHYKHALRLISEGLYEDRGEYVTGTIVKQLPRTAQDILRPTRDWRFQ